MTDLDLFFDFILQSVGYFITSYFLFSVFGRRKKVGYGLLLVLFLSNLLPVIRAYPTLELKQFILVLVYQVGPVFFALLIFASITGGIPLIKIKRRKFLKSIPTSIQTKQMNKRTSILVILASIVAGGTAYFIFHDITFYLILVFAVIGLIFGLLLLFNSAKITKERVILIVGRNKEKFYSYDIPLSSYKVEINDFFKDDRYIIDPIGEVNITTNDKKIEKDYLYWLATGEKVSIEKPLYELNILSYQDDLDLFEKYHIKHVWFNELSSGKLEKIKEKVIK